MATKSDPHRLPRRNHFRNHFQEGPKFKDPDRLAAVGVVARPRFGRGTKAPLSPRSAGNTPAAGRAFPLAPAVQCRGIVGLIDRYRPCRRSDLRAAVERVAITVRLLTYWNSRRIAAEFDGARFSRSATARSTGSLTIAVPSLDGPSRSWSVLRERGDERTLAHRPQRPVLLPATWRPPGALSIHRPGR